MTIVMLVGLPLGEGNPPVCLPAAAQQGKTYDFSRVVMLAETAMIAWLR